MVKRGASKQDRYHVQEKVSTMNKSKGGNVSERDPPAGGDVAYIAERLRLWARQDLRDRPSWKRPLVPEKTSGYIAASMLESQAATIATLRQRLKTNRGPDAHVLRHGQCAECCVPWPCGWAKDHLGEFCAECGALSLYYDEHALADKEPPACM